MEKGDSPSPAPSNQGNGNHIDQTEDAILHDGFQQLIQHNNASTTPTPLSARTPTPSSYPEQQQHRSRHHQPQSDDYHYHPHQQQSSSHQYSVDLHGYMGSDPHSRYSSPALESRLAVPGLADDEFNTSPPLTHSPYPQQASHPHSYPGAGLYQHGGYQIDPSPYPQLPDMGSSTTPHNAYSTPATSPPASLQNDPMTTRSGRTVTRSYGEPALGPQSSRVAKPTARPKKRRRAENRRAGGQGKGGPGTGGAKEVDLEAPLSVLCQDVELADGPDVDIEEYVRRSPEQRRVEVAGSKDQKIKRPMNAFMLYRKAYQNRTKALRKQQNHQFISQVCGVGWNMEPQDLRDRFDELAKIERENHRLAFPDYKFSPTKNPAPKKAEEEEESAAAAAAAATRQLADDGPVLEEYNYDSPPPSRNASRGTRSSSLFGDPDGDYRPPRGASTYNPYAPPPQQQQQQQQQQQSRAHHPHQHQHPGSYGMPSSSAAAYQSSFHYSNPGKPRPGDYGTGLGQNQYYQQSSEMLRAAYPHHINAYGGSGGGMHGVPAFVENVYVNKTNSPSGGPSSSYHQHQHQQHHSHGSPIDPYADLLGSAYHHQPPAAHHRSMQMQMHHHQSTPTPPPPPPPSSHHQYHHPIDPSLMTHAGGGGSGSVTGHHDAYDDLGLLGLDQDGGQFADGMVSYDLVDQHHQHHPQQQQQQQQQQQHSDSHAQLAQQQETTTTTSNGNSNDDNNEGAARSTQQWQEDPAAAAAAADETKLGRDWEMLGESGEFQLEDIDQILGTTGSSSPG
ncbi:hypothetical protein F4809DRAFT_377511 [Biscogniauxia mediterranea]|nr:hypothetical protein F4809DRAFT_377511 [Biscogniauxia mediterranea]